MTNAKTVFDLAIKLMDEQHEKTGSAFTQDTKEYELRTLSILNVLRHELYIHSDTYAPGFICPEIKTMEQEIDLDDTIAQGVMPYGLAAHLLLGENDGMASFFNQRYTELMYKLGNSHQAEWEDIVM